MSPELAVRKWNQSQGPAKMMTKPGAKIEGENKKDLLHCNHLGSLAGPSLLHFQRLQSLTNWYLNLVSISYGRAMMGEVRLYFVAPVLWYYYGMVLHQSRLA